MRSSTNRSRSALLVAFGATLWLAPAVQSEAGVPPGCTATVSASRRGQRFGPFPEIEGAVYPLPGVPKCNGFTITSASSCDAWDGESRLVGDMGSESSADVEETPDGTGCQLVVTRSRHWFKYFDFEHDPRVRGRPPSTQPSPNP